MKVENVSEKIAKIIELKYEREKIITTWRVMEQYD